MVIEYNLLLLKVIEGHIYILTILANAISPKILAIYFFKLSY